ncbi:hypothetical protein SETIT_2G053500v2 [Setaria italica]|uniref:Uncharacterized protein n=1 Tax=Setaria italica TaxID=4555 RepID=A0A368PWB9_SETIT|nr:hypothetical protein SETIT_2G053500v2 [Setaria italica]
MDCSGSIFPGTALGHSIPRRSDPIWAYPWCPAGLPIDRSANRPAGRPPPLDFGLVRWRVRARGRGPGARSQPSHASDSDSDIVPNQQHKAQGTGRRRSVRRVPSRTRPCERLSAKRSPAAPGIEDRGYMELDLLGLGLPPATAGHGGNHTITMHTGRHSHQFQSRSSTAFGPYWLSSET